MTKIECPDCVQSSGYIRGGGGRYIKCETCTDGVVEVETVLPSAAEETGKPLQSSLNDTP